MKVKITDSDGLTKDDYKTIASCLKYLKETDQISGDLTKFHIDRIIAKVKKE